MKPARARFFSALLAFCLCAFSAPAAPKPIKPAVCLPPASAIFKPSATAPRKLNSFRSLSFFPNEPVAQSRLGLIYYDEGRPSRAIAFLARAHRLTPKDALITLRLGQVLTDAGDFKQGAELVAAAMAAMPANREAPLACVKAAQTSADLDSVRKLLNAAQSKNPSNPAFAAALGMIDLRQTNAAAAESHFNQAPPPTQNLISLISAWPASLLCAAIPTASPANFASPPSSRLCAPPFG